MAHVLFGPEVREMLQENNREEMTAFCENLHPATVAEALADEFSVEEVWRFLENTSIRNQAAIFEYFPLEWQVKMVEGAGRERMAHLVEKMSHDDRVDLLRRLMPRVADGLLRLVDEADRKDIATLVNQKENTAGALMTTEYAWLPANISAAEAIRLLRLQSPDRETIYYVFVLDDQHRLMGVVSLRDLIMAQPQALIREIMEEQVVSVKASDDREVVAKEIARYDLLAIPVVDDAGRMVGIVTYDDVIDVVVQEATEDAYRMGAVQPLEKGYLESNFFSIWRKRAIWLSFLFVAELATFNAMSHFEDSIAQLVVLSLFVPLCISTGGNSGSQAATLITRAMALGEVTIGQWFRVFRHELVLGIALGLSLGCIGLVRGAVTPEGTRRNPKTMDQAFEIALPENAKLQQLDANTWIVPKNSTQSFRSVFKGEVQVEVPEGSTLTTVPDRPGVYQFPEKSVVRGEPVNRWDLAMVIGLAVAIICLWGTLIGAMLPLAFKRMGFDPGFASSPFVATFVDVTGIIIYFSIASAYLL